MAMDGAVAAEDYNRIRVARRDRKAFGPRGRRVRLKWLKIGARRSQSEDRCGAHDIRFTLRATALLQTLVHKLHEIFFHFVVFSAVDVNHVAGAVGREGYALAELRVEVQVVNRVVGGGKRSS